MEVFGGIAKNILRRPVELDFSVSSRRKGREETEVVTKDNSV